MVSTAKIQNNDVKTAIEESLSLLDYSFDKNLKKIVIKTNACYYWDRTTGQTTDPLFIASLVNLLREKISPVVDIAIVESDASAMKCKYAFRFLGYEKLFKTHNVRLVNLSEEKGEEISVMCGEQTYKFLIPEIIHSADLKINVPKIKYMGHGLGLTCALKNIYGCNPYPQKFKYHPKLGSVIVALNKAMKFDLCIIDGNIVSGIKPRKLGLVMASRDPVAIDAAAARVAGLNPNKIEYLKLANQEGLGQMNFVHKGLPLGHFKAMYPRKTFTYKLKERGVAWVIRLKLGKRLGLS